MNLCRAFLFSQLCNVASSSRSIRGGGDERELEDRIIGGTQSTKGDYPFAVSLQDDVGHFCGGSLIAPNAVLSAAHCQQRRTGYKAIVGRHDLRTVEGYVRNVARQIVHPAYNQETTDNDYMILILDRDVDVNPVRVSPDVVRTDAAVTVMGWGDTNPSESFQSLSSKLMETEVNVMSNGQCEKSSGTVGGVELFGFVIGGYEQSYQGKITENMMCARDRGEDSCQGDSGGPLVLKSGSKFEQVGIVSWGVGCADQDFPGVYARVSAKYEWIKSNVCEYGSSPPASFGCQGQSVGATANQDVNLDDSQFSAGEGGWTTVIKEDFSTGFGLFDHTDNEANHYTSAQNRRGVVRISNGDGFKSNEISLGNNPFTLFKVAFSFYGIKTEASDNLCIAYELDGGAVTGQKCLSSQSAFENSRWYDDKSIVFSISGAEKLRLQFKVLGDDNEDDVLIDSVTIQGLK